MSDRLSELIKEIDNRHYSYHKIKYFKHNLIISEYSISHRLIIVYSDRKLEIEGRDTIINYLEELHKPINREELLNKLI